MKPLHFPCAPGRRPGLAFATSSLKFGEDLLLSPGSLTRLSTCEHVPLDQDVAYASVLRPLLPYVMQALDEVFPSALRKLELTSDGEFTVTDSRRTVSRHALDNALNFVFSVERGASTQERHSHLSLFVAYCVAALVARSVSDLPTDEKPWLALNFLAVRVVRAGFTPRHAHETYLDQLEAARVAEGALSLDARLGLDRGADQLLPTQRVRAPGEAALLPTIPWPGLLGARIPEKTTFEVAERLGCDVYAERLGTAAHAIGRVAQQPVSLTEGVSDLNGLLDQMTPAMDALAMDGHRAHEMALKSSTGTFRSSSLHLESYGRVFHVWRPLVSSLKKAA